MFFLHCPAIQNLSIISSQSCMDGKLHTMPGWNGCSVSAVDFRSPLLRIYTCMYFHHHCQQQHIAQVGFSISLATQGKAKVVFYMCCDGFATDFSLGLDFVDWVLFPVLSFPELLFPSLGVFSTLKNKSGLLLKNASWSLPYPQKNFLSHWWPSEKYLQKHTLWLYCEWFLSVGLYILLRD